MAEQLTVDVFCDLWLGAGAFDSMGDSVIGWIMKLARNRALEHLQRSCTLALKTSAIRAFAAPVLELIVDWPTTRLPFSAPLWQRIVERISTGGSISPLQDLPSGEKEPAWEEPASGIYCKLLSTDSKRGRVK